MNTQDVRYLGFAHRHSNCVIPKPAVSFLGLALQMGHTDPVKATINHGDANELPFDCNGCGERKVSVFNAMCDDCLNEDKAPFPCRFCEKPTDRASNICADCAYCKEDNSLCLYCRLGTIPCDIRCGAPVALCGDDACEAHEFMCRRCYHEAFAKAKAVNRNKGHLADKSPKSGGWKGVKPGDYVEVKLLRRSRYSDGRKFIRQKGTVQRIWPLLSEVELLMDKSVRYGNHQSDEHFEGEHILHGFIDGKVDEVSERPIKLVKVIWKAK
jgi:hypothetical protein